jgi:hypothetical protein
MRKHPNSHREAKATAPVLDSTRDFTHRPQSLSSPGNPAECIHSQHFAGVTWMFSFKPFLESRYVAVATRGPGTVHFIATFATTNRTSHAL